MLQASNSDLAFIAAREAWCLTAYEDNGPAIAFGEHGPDVVLGMTITREESITRFLKRVEAEEKSLNIIFKDALLEQHHFGALLSSIWNVGATKLRGNQKLISAVEVFGRNKSDAGLRDWAAYQLSQVNFSELKGPFNFSRRCREAILFMTGDYGDISTVKFWDAGKNPRIDKPEIIPMPVFRT